MEKIIITKTYYLKNGNKHGEYQYTKKDELSIQQALNYKLRQLKSYNFKPESSIQSRIKKAPEYVLYQWRAMDKRNDYISYIPSDTEFKEFQKLYGGN